MKASINFKAIFFVCKKFILTCRIFIFALLFLVALLYLGVIFYFYVWQAQAPTEVFIKKLSVDSALYQKAVAGFRQRELNFEQEESRTYLDPFK